MAYIPYGYWTESSFVGLMPDGRMRAFVSDREYYEVIRDLTENPDE